MLACENCLEISWQACHVVRRALGFRVQVANLGGVGGRQVGLMLPLFASLPGLCSFGAREHTNQSSGHTPDYSQRSLLTGCCTIWGVGEGTQVSHELGKFLTYYCSNISPFL